MQTFKAYFKKEIMESLRTHKYIILAAGFILWALLNPLMLKLLPVLLKSSIPAEMISQITDITRVGAFQNLLGQIFQVSTLFIAFSLMNTLSGEVAKKKLVFPYSRGASPGGIVLAKYFHYFAAISIIILVAFLSGYFYIIALFPKGGTLELNSVLRSALLFVIFYAFVLAMLLFFSSIVKKSIISGLSTLAITYLLSIFNQFNHIRKYFPNYLIFKSSDAVTFDVSLIPALLITIGLITLLVYLAVLRMKRVEVG